MAQVVKNPPAMRETWVRSLGWEDPLEEGMAPHCSIPAWRIPMDRGAWWATVLGVPELDVTELLNTHTQEVVKHSTRLQSVIFLFFQDSVKSGATKTREEKMYD